MLVAILLAETVSVRDFLGLAQERLVAQSGDLTGRETDPVGLGLDVAEVGCVQFSLSSRPM